MTDVVTTMSRAPEPPPDPAAPTSLFVEVAGRRLALAFDVVSGVCDRGRLVAVPGTQPWCLGLVALHGRLMTLVDAGLLFFGEPTGGRSEVVLKDLAVDTALSVDALLGTGRDTSGVVLALDRAALARHPAFQLGAAARCEVLP